MSENPAALVRLIGSAAVVVLTLAAVGAALFGVGPSGVFWAGLIAGTAVFHSLVAFAVDLARPADMEAAWDEQNSAAYQSSLAFGYYTTLVLFLVFLPLAVTGRMHAEAAYYWLGPVLAAAPPTYYLLSVIRGRAE